FCYLLQPILVYMSKVDGKFKFSPIGINFLTEVSKVLFAIIMLLFQKITDIVVQFSHLKVLVIAVLLKIIMQRRFSIIQVTVPSMASVYNEYALKSQFETSIYLQLPLPMPPSSATSSAAIALLRSFVRPPLLPLPYILIILLLRILKFFIGPGNFNILEGHSKATMFLICNNAAQGILSSFFFKYAGKLECSQCL
ncbi:hypothetical protein B296_00038031, partial [Ensete ventricosum]